MGFNKKDNKNLLLNQINNEDTLVIKELVPSFSNDENDIKFLTFGNDVRWSSIKHTNNLVISSNTNGDIILDTSINVFKDTGMHFKNGQIGIGGLPLYEYIVDIRVPENTRMTAMHIGDGTYGFSLGNAANTGFLPQIIGMGSNKDDAGLYFLGKTSSEEPSNIPAIILDGRNNDNTPLQNRPIFGISSGSYSEYKLIIDSSGNIGIGKLPEIYKLEINGVLKADNIMISNSSGIILNLIEEIEELKERLKILEAK